MSNDMLNELSSYIGLLVQHAGGEIRLSYEEVEAGIPGGKRIKISMDEDTSEVVFEMVDKEEA